MGLSSLDSTIVITLSLIPHISHYNNEWRTVGYQKIALAVNYLHYSVSEYTYVYMRWKQVCPLV